MAVSPPPALEDLCAALRNDRRIAALYLFGSHARGTASRSSDVDLGLLFRREVEASAYFPLRLEYLASFISMLRTSKVDSVVLNDARPHLAYEIVSRGELLVDLCPVERVAFEAERVGRYLDIKPWLAVQLRAAKRQLLTGTFFD
jgi:predicted nucleotidyltransferase